MMFKSAGQELPGFTQMVINISHFMKDYWYLVFGGVGGAIWAFSAYYKTKDGRNTCDSIFIQLPIFGSLIQKGAIARLTRTLGTMLSCGVGIIDALEISSNVVGNVVIERAVLKAKLAIAEGKSITQPLSQEKFIPSMVVQMIGVGEATGTLDSMLNKIADFYEEEVDYAVGALTSIMEPMMMVFLGGIIAVLVVAMYLPIFNMAGAVK
jgi:type IV pilus assembly protein PilC